MNHNLLIGPLQRLVPADTYYDMVMVGNYCERRNFNREHIGKVFQPIRNPSPSVIVILLSLAIFATQKRAVRIGGHNNSQVSIPAKFNPGGASHPNLLGQVYAKNTC